MWKGEARAKRLTIWMTDYSNNLGFSSGSDLTVDSLDEVKTTPPQLPSPSLVSNTMLPEVGLIEWREWHGAVTNEASGSVSVETEHERNKEVVGVPEGLEGLLSDFGVGGGIHEKHAEEHDVSSDSTGLGVVDLDSSDWSNLVLLDVEEAIARLVF